MSTFPATIGGCLAELSKAYRALDVIDAKREPAAQRVEALRAHLLNTFKKTELSGAKGAGLSLAVVQSTSPQLTDWGAFFKFASRKGNDDLLTRKVSSEAWRARLEAKVAVPGVIPFHNVSLRVTRVKK